MRLSIQPTRLAVILAAILSACVDAATVKTDSGVYREPPLPVLGSAGSRITDPTFGTTIIRLTDASDGSDCQTQYSYWPAFNCNSTRVQILCLPQGTTALRTMFMKFDSVTLAVTGKSVFQTPPAGEWLISRSDSIWSGVHPDIIFGHNNFKKLYAYNVATGVYTMIKDFSSIVLPGGGLNQMSKSRNDDTFAFTLTNSTGAYSGYVAWRRSTDTVLLKQIDSTVDEVALDKSGQYLVMDPVNGNNKIWDLQTNTFTQLTWGVDGFFHYANGVGTTVTGISNPHGLGIRNLATPHSTKLLLKWPISRPNMHYSLLCDDESWVEVSSSVANSGAVQYAFDNEIFQVATDGSGRVRRLAHHRSMMTGYDASPRANISQDGRFIAFTSNWGNASGRTDVFVVVVPPVTNPNPAPIASLSTNGTSFTAPASITLSATASDSNGAVSKVDFYNGATLLNTDITAPYAFTWTNVAAGSYALSAKATDNGGAVGVSNTVTVSVAVSVSNNAAAGTVSIPTAMTAGRAYAVLVAMRNSGTSTWTAAAGYKLGSQNPQDNTTWGTNRILLAPGDSIAPGQTKTFTFNVTAPVTARTYNCQWRMVREGVQWFGALSPNVSVTVSPDGGGSGSGTLNIAPEADTRIDELDPTVNFASATHFSVDGGPAGKLRKAYLRFNVTGLPAGAVVTDARLILVCRSPSLVSGGNIRKFQPTNATWAEIGPTWQSPLAGANASDVLATLGAVAVDGTYAFTNLSSAVSANGRVTFIMRSTSDDGATYYSKEHTTAGQRPVLRISYVTVAAPTGTG
jgi:hypothetical protein